MLRQRVHSVFVFRSVFMMRSVFLLSSVFVLSMSCVSSEPPEPTNSELCEASDTCAISDFSDEKNFNCVMCEEGMKWENSKPDDLNCVPMCEYPEDFNKFNLTVGDIAPPLAWTDAYWGDGSQTPFSFEDFYCNAPEEKVALVILGSTGWCGYCPPYVDHVSSMAAELNAAGAQVVYFILEKQDGSPASSEYAQNYVTEHPVTDDFSVRVGGEAQWIYNGGKTVEDKPGGIQTSYFPFGWMIKRDNMKVVLDEVSNDPAGGGIIYMDWLAELYKLKNGDFDD
jgi:hypothetical protein